MLMEGERELRECHINTNGMGKGHELMGFSI